MGPRGVEWKLDLGESGLCIHNPVRVHCCHFFLSFMYVSARRHESGKYLTGVKEGITLADGPGPDQYVLGVL